MLPFGNGRSYGDVCLNDRGILLDTRGLDRFIAFDSKSGILRCESGVLLSELLRLTVPCGWFLPVTPGTQFVTVGGAVANDVHGKNHHRAGTFGAHVRSLELLRSDGSRRTCSTTQNTDWFAATVGGLGLTGLITWVELQLRPILGSLIDQEVIRFRNLREFFQLSRDSDRLFEYTVAWIDCAAKGRSLGRGLFIRGNHSPERTPGGDFGRRRPLRVPIDPPFTLVNRLTLRIFNSLYFHRQFRDITRNTVHYAPFFYPLDAVLGWNRVYGSRGLLQYQCVIPDRAAEAAVAELLTQIAQAGTGSFLAVLKVFGAMASPGLLSFPRPGATLALDFPNHGANLFRLLDRLDAIVMSAGGAQYPAKDSRMSPQMFAASFSNLRLMSDYVDPRFSSGLWRRLTGAGS